MMGYLALCIQKAFCVVNNGMGICAPETEAVDTDAS
jgi:hypothetical protein